MGDDANKVYRLVFNRKKSNESIGWANGNRLATVADELTPICDTQISNTYWKGFL
jgi:hypothetical protein